MTNIIKLDGNIRENLGSSCTRRLRKVGRLPAVIYSGSENIFIDVDIKRFEAEYSRGNLETRIIEIETKEKTFKTTLYQLDLDPVSDRPRHVDFMSLEDKKEVRVFVPIKILNRDKSSGMKKNGFLNILRRKIQLLCEVNSIPESIEIDIAELKLKQAILSSQLTLPKGCKFVNKKDFMILNILGRGKEDEEENKQVAAATSTTTTAATTSTPAAKEAEKKK